MQGKRLRTMIAWAAGTALVLVLLMQTTVLYAGTAEEDGAANANGTIPISITLTASQDNTLYESATGNISNGAGDYLFAGQTNQGAIRRGLLAFDLTDKLPAGATIVSATLQLRLSKTSAGPTTVSLHRVLANWGEGSSNANSNEGGGVTATTGDATWLHTLFNTTLWQAPGGDFAATASATATVAGVADYQWRSPTLLADVQGWVANPATNFGWLIMGDEGTSGTAKRFDSRENPTAANRPQLTITYTMPTTEIAKIFLPVAVK